MIFNILGIWEGIHPHPLGGGRKQSWVQAKHEAWCSAAIPAPVHWARLLSSQVPVAVGSSYQYIGGTAREGYIGGTAREGFKI